MSHFFYDNNETLIDQALEGIIRTSPWGNLARLNPGQGLRIVVRNDWDKSQVAVLSGGGSGHEPMHAGFFGKGMLTWAICGDILASPGVDAILAAINNLTGEAGCLLVVKNYTGDRLNFGLAAEKARGLGYKVEMLLVKDDIALPDSPQPRGLSGTILAHKIAGYAASLGADLSQVVRRTKALLQRIATIGVALAGCHQPGVEYDQQRLPSDHSELGMGIHGEHGVAMLHTQNSREIVNKMSDVLIKHLDDKGNLLLMLNNLGGFSALEMALVSQAVLQTPLAARISFLQGPATLVSALDMKGFSLTALPLDAEILQALQALVEVTGWTPVYAQGQMQLLKAVPLPEQTQVTPSENSQVKQWLSAACQALIDNEQSLNMLDSHVGDGDTGSTLATGARYILNMQQQQPLNNPAALLSWLGERIITPIGGSPGVLLSLMFSAAGEYYQQQPSLAMALQAGLQKMKDYGGAKTGDRTMIDALQPAFDALEKGGDLSAVSQAAEQGAKATADMLKAGAGRSACLNKDSLKGYPDPGAVAVSRVFSAIAGSRASRGCWL